MSDSGSTIPSPDSPEERDQVGQAPPGYPPSVAPASPSPTEILPAQEPAAEPGARPRWVPPAPPSSPPAPGYGPSPSYQPLPDYGPPPSYQPAPAYGQGPQNEQGPGPQPGPRYKEAPRYGQGPGYQQAPGYQRGPGPGGYQQPPGYQQGPGPGGYQQAPGGWGSAQPGPALPRRRTMADLADTPPQLVASLVISAGVVVLFIANFFIALGQPTGTAGNARLLQFLSGADLAVGALLVLAVALVALAPPPALASVEPTSLGPTAAGSAALPDKFRLIAGFVAVAVAVAGLVRAIAVLTVAHTHGAVKLGNMIDALAAVAVAAAAAYWALRPR